MRRFARAFHASRFAFHISFILLLLLASCSASTAPVVKIGLVAPFEGRYRAIGYEAIYAARLAVREINRGGGVQGVRVELLALDDGGEPDRAIEQARKLAIDPQIVAVLGHYRPDATDAAIDVYCAEALPLLAIESASSSACPGVFTLTPLITDTRITDPESFTFIASVLHPAEVPGAAAFIAAYTAIPIDGAQPGPIALQTYDAMYLLFDALARGHAAGQTPTREDLAQALPDEEFFGLGGAYRFTTSGERMGLQRYVYRYSKDHPPERIQ
ncbi:MAG TPA: ABC transporter substrate-binding protein [Anaerolineae bacterium]|nr:ABC transporter substrate-binding protein [Anaerolineae bacterium]